MQIDAANFALLIWLVSGGGAMAKAATGATAKATAMAMAMATMAMATMMTTTTTTTTVLNADVTGRAAICAEQPLRNHEEMAELAMLMTQRFIAPKTNTLVISEKCQLCAMARRTFHERLLTHFLLNFVPTMTLQLFFSRADEKPWDYNIFVVDTDWAFRSLLLQIPKTKHDREFYFYVLLTQPPELDERHRRRMLGRIFRLSAQHSVTYVVAMVQRRGGVFDFYTYGWQGPPQCQLNARVTHVNRWQNDRLLAEFLFPPRLSDLRGCPLHVCGRIHYPFFNFDGDPANATRTHDPAHFSGIEGDLLKVLGRNMNFKIRFSVSRELNSKMGGTGLEPDCLKAVRSAKASVAIGGYARALANHDLYSTSFPYHQTKMVFVVRSSLQYGPFKQLGNPFDAYLWLTILGTLLLAWLVIRLLHGSRARHFVLGARNRYPFSNLFIILLGNPVATLPQRNFARYLLMLWMLMTLLLRSAYQGKLYDALRISLRTPLPQTIGELSERDYTLLHSSYVDYYPHNKTLIMPSLWQRFVAVTESRRPFAAIAMRDTLAFYNYHNWNSSCLTHISEPIFMFQLVMYYRKNSVIRGVFDRKLKRLVDSGIAAHIADTHVEIGWERMNEYAQFVSQISNSMLVGLYGIFALMSALAIVVFGLECGAGRSAWLRRIFDWVHFN